MLLHGTWVTFIVNAEVEAVEALPMFAFRVLHWSLAGMYICWPVLVPQIAGGDLPPGTVTLKESVSQLPTLFAATGVPMVMVVAVTGLFNANVSKSSLNWQTVESLLQIVRPQELPLDRDELVK